MEGDGCRHGDGFGEGVGLWDIDGENRLGEMGFGREKGWGRKMGWVRAMGWLRDMACSPQTSI